MDECVGAVKVFFFCLSAVSLCVHLSSTWQWKMQWESFMWLNYPVAMQVCSIILELWHSFLEVVQLFLCTYSSARHSLPFCLFALAAKMSCCSFNCLSHRFVLVGFTCTFLSFFLPHTCFPSHFHDSLYSVLAFTLWCLHTLTPASLSLSFLEWFLPLPFLFTCLLPFLCLPLGSWLLLFLSLSLSACTRSHG